MDSKIGTELDRRDLLKTAAGGVLAATVAAGAAHAQDKGALRDASVVTQEVTFPNGAATIKGFLARPQQAGKFGAVVIIPGIFGVDNYIKETAAQVAQAGLVGLALDFYSRANSPVPGDFAELRTFVGEHAPDRQIVSDAQAAVEYLKKQPFTNGKFGVTGFCMGGRVTLLIAALVPDIAAASPYYGMVKGSGPTQMDPSELIGRIRVPVEGHYGETDRNPPPDDVRAFFAKLAETNKDVNYHIYPGAGHAFHTFDRPSFNEAASTQAWARSMAFFQKHLK